jgi:hypothetical protein
MNKTILMDTANIPKETFDGIISEYTQSLDIKIIYERVPSNISWQKTSDLYKTISYDQLAEGYVSSYDSMPPWNCIADFLCRPETLIVAERTADPFFGISVFHQMRRAEQFFCAGYNYLKKIRPEMYLFYGNPPHNLRNWAFAYAAETLGIRVCWLEFSPLPWRVYIRKGLTEQNVIQIPLKCEEGLNIHHEDEVDKFIAINQASYKEAIPENVKRVLERTNKWSYLKQIMPYLKSLFRQGIFHRLKRLTIDPFFLLRKSKAYKYYESLCIHDEIPSQSITLFLQHQPEATSMPRGGIFTNQWFIADLLARNLPPGWKLLIKDHPVTFFSKNIVQKYDERYRSLSFYEQLAQLPNTKLISLDTSTFDIIDKTRAVVTMTGTPGIQALCRGKPMLCFGRANYVGAPGVFTINSTEDIQAAFTKIQSNTAIVPINELRAYLLKAILYSSNGWNDPCVFENTGDIDTICINAWKRIIGPLLRKIENE